MAHKRKASTLSKDGSEPADSDGSEDELNNVSDETDHNLESRSGTKEWMPIPLTQAQQMATSKSALLGLMTLAVSRAALPQAATVTTASAAAASRGSPCPASPVGSEQGATGTPRDTASNPEDTSSNGNKDDEDDEADDDNDDDKIDAHHDPERMKSFNMFVRLFVDENLDRIVPISKQPKEKIQAIIDACGRQFPEFAERTRKRIRTYLKSCRRNKRTRDSNGLDTSSRPTPPHLTSIQAEQILASACENEAQNAKRMRLGLEPIAQPNPLTQHMQLQQALNDKPLSMIELRVKTEPTPSSHTSVLAKALERPLDQSLSEGKVMNGSSMFQASFQQNFQKMSSLTGSTVHSQPGITPLLQTTSAGVVSNGPTDLSVKSIASKVVRPALNIVEVASVRQLITGYRESAAFLLRSADELENLLVHHQAPK